MKGQEMWKNPENQNIMESEEIKTEKDGKK